MITLWTAIILTNIAIAILAILHWRLAREVREVQQFIGEMLIASMIGKSAVDRSRLERLYKDE